MVALLFTLLLQSAPAPALSVDDIMSRVAENQGRAEDARKRWVYEQDVLVRMFRTNGKLAREESSLYTVTPRRKRITRERTKFGGKYELKGKLISYDEPDFKYKGLDIDGDVVRSVADDIVDEKESKDGVSSGMFPLTAQEQAKYNYKLEAREDYQGHDVYRITFTPKAKQEGADWKGEALIDATEFQPVVVTTKLAWGMPTAVKILLGTDIHHVGFKVTYKKLDDGVWFPYVYGGELSVKGLFLYKRSMSVSVKNGNFHKTAVASTVTFEEPH